MNVRQNVVVRRDLNMTPGLLAAQVAHISAQFMLSKAGAKIEQWTDVEKQWFNSPVLGVLAVNTPEELDVLKNLAVEVGVPYCTWKDTIWFDSLKRKLEVVVGVAFGPCDDEKLVQVTGGLPLY